MRKTLVLGSQNRHKLAEISPLLEDLGLDLRVAGEFGPFAPEEHGSTLEENAILKARAAMELSQAWSFADDTGLEVDALDGRPGLHAARYAGPGCSFADNIRKLLEALRPVQAERRTARFACVLALCRPGHAPMIFRAGCGGRILEAPRGAEGFGYDPVFEVQGLGKTFAELSLEEKNRVSHRARAVRLLRAELLNLFLQTDEPEFRARDAAAPIEDART